MTAFTRPGSGPVTEAFATGLLRGALEIPSPSYGEAELARFLVDTMREQGYQAHVDPAGNVIGQLDRGPGPTVMLLGHLDTIPGIVPVRVDAGRLYGRGAVDAKGPLATMICAALGARGFRGRLVVVGAVEEETPLSRGAVAVRSTFDPPDALIVGEPSGWANVVMGYKGKLDLRYAVTVAATHPSNPTAKAVELAVQAWQRLLDLLGPEIGHGSFDRPGATLTTLFGDATSAEANIDVRLPPEFDAERLVAELDGALDQGSLSVVNVVAACRTDRRDPVVRALSAGIRAQRGRPTCKLKTGTSDMNTMAERWNVPMATYGPGDSKLDHSDDEHIVLADYFRGIAVLTHALEELGEQLAPTTRPRIRLVGSTR